MIPPLWCEVFDFLQWQRTQGGPQNATRQVAGVRALLKNWRKMR